MSEWIGARCDDYLFPERQGAGVKTAIMMLLDAFPPHFALLDAYDSAADGLIGVMGCPASASGRDDCTPASDALALGYGRGRGHMGVRDPPSIEHHAGRPATGSATRPRGPKSSAWMNRWQAGAGRYHNDLSALLSILALPVLRSGAAGRGTLFRS